MTPTLGSLFVGKHNNLTFIRLLAALTVIYGHTPSIVPGTPADWVTRTTNYAFSGGVAVDLFFLISGFLVTASILKGGVRRYVIARVLRIYPALWVNLILTTFVMGAVLTTLPLGDYLKHREVWSYFLGLAGTFRGAFFLPGVFEGNADHAINGSIWSVLIEVWLYVVLLVIYLLGILQRRAVFNVVFFVGIVALWSAPELTPGIFNNSTSRHVCLLFCIGAFLYINRDTVPVSPFYLLIALFLAGITLGTDRFPYAYVLLLTTFFCTASFYAQFAWLDRWGDLSYGVYLYGWPCQQLIAHYFPHLTGMQNCIYACTAALICGFLSWHLVEKRAMRLKDGFSAKVGLAPMRTITST